MAEQTESQNCIESTLALWEKLLVGAEANRGDLPALERYVAQLQAALDDARAARDRQQELYAAARGATQELHRRVTLGRELAARLQAGVRLLYGRRSPKLPDFGMKPLVSWRHRRAGVGCPVQGCPLEATPTAK